MSPTANYVSILHHHQTFHVLRIHALLSHSLQLNPCSSYHGSETDISLLFLPGNHSLDCELSVANVANFSMTKDVQNNESVIVICIGQSGRFNISVTVLTSVRGLHFTGCGSNTVTKVDLFKLEDTIFQSMYGGRVLELNMVDAAKIVRSSFFSNSTFSVSGEFIAATNSSFDVFDSAFSAGGGVMYTSGSSFNITSSTFTNNTAVYNSYTSDSAFNIINSTFINNTADYDGGVLVAVESSFNNTGSILS